MKPRAAISWSGGKDSLAALDRARSTCDVVASVTMVDEQTARSRSHGLRPDVIAAPAARLALDPRLCPCTGSTYEAAFSGALDELASRGITHVVFGDILFDEHRLWAEQMCGRSGLTAVEPLWGCSTEALFEDWVASGADALVVTARATFFDRTWVGRRLDRTMAAEFARRGVDPCGERGEYHTVVTNCSLFRAPVRLHAGRRVQRGGCWTIDLAPDADDAARPS
jgi:uncharacterized protein (TIGR00290 family)